MRATDFSPLSCDGFGPVVRTSPSVARSVTRARPPRGFKLIQGEASNVRFGGTVPTQRGHTRAQRLGIAYETRVHDVLSEIYGERYSANPSILYEDRKGLRRAIPDGLLYLDENALLVCEIKLTHTERAWWQLRRLYIPLLGHLVRPGVRIFGVEICRNFDPDLRWPEPFEVLTSLHKVGSKFGVIQWRL